MSEQLSREQRRQLIDLLAALPCTRTEDDRHSLLAGIPPRLRPPCAGNIMTALGSMIEHLEALETLDSGESALAIFVENAWETVKGTTPGRELEDLLNSLGGGASRLAELR